MKKRPVSRREGFSLIEVVLALGVAVFCLLPIVGLIPIGLTTNQDTIRETTATSLAEAVASDLKATPSSATTSPYYSLGVPATGGSVTTTTLYLTGAGSSIDNSGTKLTTPSTTEPTYLATVVVTPAATGTLNASTARILITWPALPNQLNNQAPTQYQGSFEAIVGLSRN
jgi:uncharacterized protein (TIGR02598 family)